MKNIRTLIVVVIVFAIIVVLVLDGSAMYGSRNSAIDLAKETANSAAQAYVSSKQNETVAENTAYGIVEGAEGDAEMVSIKFNKGWHDSYVIVSVRTFPETILLGKIPGVKNALWQKSTAEARF